jgi:outer membrane protein OmpA-like peptidoglycan-associated protein
MRTFPLLLALACAGTASLGPPAAHAQTTMDQRALEPLQPRPATPEPAKPAPAKPAPPPHRTTPHPASAHPAPPAPPPVTVPPAPPPPPVLPPPLVVPTRPPAPPPPIPIAADAPGDAQPMPDGVRITFGDSRADLNPATETALRALAHAAPADASFTIAAFAPSIPDDPSTPRRLALSRALTVRSVLIAEGVVSERIYVKALGDGRGVADGPADRADVITAATSPQAKPPP